MRRNFFSVALFLVSILCMGIPHAHADSLQPEFVCGEYDVIGKLKHLGPSSDVLEFYPGTTRRSELILRRVDADDEVSRNNQIVRFKVKITVPGKASQAIGRPVSAFRSASEEDAMKAPATLVSKGSCQK
jgi:hypothetical protein